MRGLLRPNLTGTLLMIPIGVACSLPRTTSRYTAGSTAPEVHWELGFHTWLSWESPGTWHLHAVAIPTLVALYCVPTVIGALLSRWRHWRLAPRGLWFFALVPVLAMAVSVMCSLNYWGYAWSLPALDSRVNDITWSAVSVFTSSEDGTNWTGQPRDELKHFRSEPAADLECCEDGRILKVVGERLHTLNDSPPGELSLIGEEVLAKVELERGEPHYGYARRLRGVVLVGEDADHRPVAFASFTSGEVSNDHYAMYEVLLARGAATNLLSSSRTYGDVAGIEGATAGRVAVALCVLGFALTPAMLTGWAMLRALFRVLIERRERPA